MSTIIEALAHGRAVPSKDDPLAQRPPSEHVRMLARGAEPINSHSRARLRGELVQIALGCASATLTVDRILDKLLEVARETGSGEALIECVKSGEL